MPVATIFLCSLLAMIIVSLLTKSPSATTLEKFFPAAGRLQDTDKLHRIGTQ
jgi:hypothetical protein